MKWLVLLLTFSSLAFAKANSVDQDLDALGGNKALMEKANAIDPKNTTRVVQNRLVDRDLRFEVDLTYGSVVGGDPYVNTNNFGANLEFHLDPHWSLGGRWYHSANSLSSEGERVMNSVDAQRAAGQNVPRPDTTSAENTYLGTISFYPFYGKISLADLAITQFDIYFMGGYGTVQTSRVTTPTYTAGGGIAFWFTQHFSSRFEARYQGYKDQLTDGSDRQMNLTILQLGIGILL